MQEASSRPSSQKAGEDTPGFWGKVDTCVLENSSVEALGLVLKSLCKIKIVILTIKIILLFNNFLCPLKRSIIRWGRFKEKWMIKYFENMTETHLLKAFECICLNFLCMPV